MPYLQSCEFSRLHGPYFYTVQLMHLGSKEEGDKHTKEW
jgi:hypothetical protein